MNKYWTAKEIDFLKENIGKTKISVIAEKLDRSETAVILKMNRLGIGNTRDQTGLITIGELAKPLGVDRNTIQGWIERHGLPVKKKVSRLTKVFTFVDSESFWNWAKINQDKIDFSKIERNSIPPEPKWVEALRFDNKNYHKKNYKTWTTNEVIMLREMREKGLRIEEIAHRLGRSVISVEKKDYSLTQKKKCVNSNA